LNDVAYMRAYRIFVYSDDWHMQALRNSPFSNRLLESWFIASSLHGAMTWHGGTAGL
jgi:hypothetical protein